jgi:hypothetical protein
MNDGVVDPGKDPAAEAYRAGIDRTLISAPRDD